jgi:hypothetical protein
MALQKSYTKTVYGQQFVFNTAYFQITDFSGLKDVIIHVTVFDSAEKNNVIDQLPYTFSLDVRDTAKNILKQGYEYLKTLDEYKEAIDVLEEGQTA